MSIASPCDVDDVKVGGAVDRVNQMRTREMMKDREAEMEPDSEKRSGELSDGGSVERCSGVEEG